MKLKSAEDTIAAISTPPGEGGIGIVRLSGPKAIGISANIFSSSRGRDISKFRQRIFHGQIHDDEGLPVDDVLLHIMRAPNSYTREDVVEINCHGGTAPLNAVLELILKHGARLAEAGEFTKRAFLNGRIDLVQAEAVMDVIQARTRGSLRAAVEASHGSLSKSIKSMHDILIDALARVEASVDFPEEDLPELVNDSLRATLEKAHENMLELLDTAKLGRLYREGASVVIAGRPNVGKSSLFNALLRDARAIVSKDPGTTRDRIEETITISGIPVRLTDTAGLRTSHDEVEKIGVDIARNVAKTADIILLVMDSSKAPSQKEAELAAELVQLGAPMILVLNKIDISKESTAPDWDISFSSTARVSALTNEGIHELEDDLAKTLSGGDLIEPKQAMLSRLHQCDSLRRAAESLKQMLSNFSASPEFLSIDLREALDALGEITGETTTEDILDKVFATFCIGK